jgi:hypothetical protein
MSTVSSKRGEVVWRPAGTAFGARQSNPATLSKESYAGRCPLWSPAASLCGDELAGHSPDVVGDMIGSAGGQHPVRADPGGPVPSTEHG